MSNELILDSLQRRFRALFSLYEDATATMTLEQVNHREKEKVMPIAFSLFHYVNMIDASMMMLNGELFLCVTMASTRPLTRWTCSKLVTTTLSLIT
jgi:hypothetical protein